MTVQSPPRPPRQDELEALIPEARYRQQRRRLLGAMTVALAAVLAVGIYAVANGARSPGTIGPSLGLGTWPSCRPGQLKTEPVLFIGTLTGGGLGFTNTSSSACSLPLGIPRARLLWHGQRLAVRQIHVAHPFRMGGEPVVHVLGPGKSAQIDFDWRNWCGPPKLSNYPRDFPTLEFQFRGGPLLEMRSGPRPHCASPTSPSTITATQPLHYHAS
jgi:hypothetical protein